MVSKSLILKVNIHISLYMHLSRTKELFAALGDSLRLRIACCLLFWKSGLCVCELVDSLDVTQPNISRHLKLMKTAGLVSERREGRWIYYRLVEGNEDLIADLHSCLENVFGYEEIQRDISKLKSRIRLRDKGKCVIGIRQKDKGGSKSIARPTIR
jgi:ArsR family transcriptional regulator, arsenate/arsenite/antimonite-responsive transcriptional repressor